MISLLILPILLLTATSSQAAQPLFIDLSAGLTLDNNITRASLNDDIEDDSIINLDASVSYQLPIDARSFYTLSGHVGINEHEDFDNLSNTLVGAELAYQRQFSSGYTAPWYLLSAGFNALEYDSRFRDARQWVVEAGLGKRLTDRVSLRSGLVWESTDADENTFDLDNRHIYFHFDYKLDHHNILYVSLGYTDGDITSVTGDTTPRSTKTQAPGNSKAAQLPRYSHHLPGEITTSLIRDDAFLSLSPNRFVYQLDATTWSLTLGDNYEIDHHQAIEGAMLYYRADTYADDYDGIIMQFSYIYRFSP